MISEANCHPFQFGNFLFMHNGGIARFNIIKRKIIQYLSDTTFSYIHGTTDSEHAGALFIELLPRHGDRKQPDPMDDYTTQEIANTLALAISKIVQFLDEIQTGDGTHDDELASSLNFCVTDGKTLVATRYRNHEWQTPPSLFYLESDTIDEKKKL